MRLALLLAVLLPFQFTASGDDGTIGRATSFLGRLISTAGEVLSVPAFGDVAGATAPVPVAAGDVQLVYLQAPADSVSLWRYSLLPLDDRGNRPDSSGNVVFVQKSTVPLGLYPPAVTAAMVTARWHPDAGRNPFSVPYGEPVAPVGGFVTISVGRADTLPGYRMLSLARLQQLADSTACSWPHPWWRTALVCP